MGEGRRLLLDDVAALEGAVALHVLGRVELGHVLAGQDERGGAGGLGDRVGVRGRGLVVVGGAHHVEVGEDAEARDRLDGLVGRPVLAHRDRVVGEDVRDGELGEGRDAHGRAHVVREDEEGGARGGEDAAVREPVRNAAHGVLADPVVEVLALVGLAEARAEVTSALDVVLVRA